jgi:hypothetical protein
LNYNESCLLFNDVYKLLNNGGLFILEYPCPEKCARKLISKDTSGNEIEFLEAIRGLYAFDLNQVKTGESYFPYKFSFSGWLIKEKLTEAGFKEIEISNGYLHNHPERDIRIVAKK